MRIALLDRNGNTLKSYTRDRCEPIESDSPIRIVTWKGIRGLPDTPVRIQFQIRNAQLYSLWVRLHNR